MHARTALLAISIALGAGCGNEAEPEPAPPQGNGGANQGNQVEDVQRQVEETIDEAKEQVEEVTAEAKAMFQDYLDKVGSLTGELTGITGLGDVGKAPGVQNLVDQVKGAVESLGGLDASTLDKLKEQFRPQLDAAMSALRTQVDRIAENPSLKPVADVLRNLELIE